VAPRSLATLASLNPIQKGTLSETCCCNAILIQTRGRVHCARPQPDDHGIDFKVYQPGTAPSLDLQIKASYTVGPGGRRSFTLHGGEVPRNPRRFFALCVLGTHTLPGVEDTAWLIPGAAFERFKRSDKPIKFFLFPQSNRKSVWNQYRLPFKDVGRTLLAHLKQAALEDGTPLPPWRRGISLIAQGKVTEDAVAFVLVVGSDGRLAVFRPFADSAGLDLDILSMDSRTSAPAQVKGIFVTHPRKLVRARVPANTFRGRPDRYIIVAPFVPATMTLGPHVWVVPADAFKRLARLLCGVYLLQASPKPGSKDRWAPYRYEPRELAGLFEAAIEVVRTKGPGARLPATRAEVEALLGKGGRPEALLKPAGANPRRPP
jgi:hypothetical protein